MFNISLDFSPILRETQRFGKFFSRERMRRYGICTEYDPGLFYALADSVPGVSGGTIAFISGLL